MKIKEIKTVISNCTESSCVSIDHDSVELIKKYCKNNPDEVIGLLSQILYSANHPQSRLLALLLLDVLVMRSRRVRLIFFQDMRSFLIGINVLEGTKPLAPAKTALYLRDEGVRRLLYWCETFGKMYPRLVLANDLCVKFHPPAHEIFTNNTESFESENDVNPPVVDQSALQNATWRSRYSRFKDRFGSLCESITYLVTEITNAFDLIKCPWIDNSTDTVVNKYEAKCESSAIVYDTLSEYKSQMESFVLELDFGITILNQISLDPDVDSSERNMIQVIQVQCNKCLDEYSFLRENNFNFPALETTHVPEEVKLNNESHSSTLPWLTATVEPEVEIVPTYSLFEDDSIPDTVNTLGENESRSTSTIPQVRSSSTVTIVRANSNISNQVVLSQVRQSKKSTLSIKDRLASKFRKLK